MGCIAYSNRKQVKACSDVIVSNKKAQLGDSLLPASSSIKAEPLSGKNEVALDAQANNVIVLKPLLSESHDNESSVKNNVEVHIKQKRTQSDNSLNVHTKADTFIQRKKKKNKLNNTGNCMPNKINSSMLLLKELAFEPQSKDLPSLIKTTPCQIITLDYQAKLYEEMIEIWVEKDCEIAFKLKGLWGVEQMGLCTFEGYPNKMLNSFPLCCLLGRIGSQSFYFHIKTNLKHISSVSGPLFLLMNIDPETVINNKWTLAGSVSIEIHNPKKYTFMQIMKMLSFDEELLAMFLNGSYSNLLYTSSELALIIIINQLRTRPDLCLSYYFPANPLITGIIKEKGKVCSFLKSNDILKKIAEEATEEVNVPFEDRVARHGIEGAYSVLKEIQFKTHFKHPSVLLLEALKAEDSFVFDGSFLYMGLSLKALNQTEEDEIMNYLCVLVMGGKNCG